ncbi:MAG: amidase domain-containing protein [Candidatus Thermoplasmatota archaeon]|nr:amidase domain-containing protein [Candidatus Thermoplasmatota archaeon]
MGNWTTSVGANNFDAISTNTPSPQGNTTSSTISAKQEAELKNVIQDYFEIRYRIMNTLQLDDFGDIISIDPKAKAFLEAELGKLAVEVKHAELNHLGYVDYEFSLDFGNFIADNPAMVTVSVIENHAVIEAISIELNPENPFVSHRYGLEHTIVLSNEQGQWKIMSDHYNDYLWKMLRQTGTSPDMMLHVLSPSPRPIMRNISAETESACGLSEDDSSHDYDRDGAVAYALGHYSGLDYNRDYPSYDGTVWGDCTNFVSQALYEGGNVSMEIPDPLPSPTPDGQSGWYLLNGLQRATDWNDVGGFFSFVNDQSAAITEGPEGCVITIDDLSLGDVIQYDWGGDGIWDHSVIVVNFQDSDPYVASHSPNISTHYTHFDYYVPGTSQIRFIRIERSDGNPPIKAQVETTSDDAGMSPGSCAYSSPNNEVYLGNCVNGGDITSGFRFNNIEIPQYAEIKYAYITFAVDGPYSDPVYVKIYGEAIGNSETFTISNPPDSRTTTSEESAVLWEITDQWDLTDNLAGVASKYSRTTPQLAPVIQEIVNRDY